VESQFSKIYSHNPLIHRLLFVDFLTLFLYPLKKAGVIRYELTTNKGGYMTKAELVEKMAKDTGISKVAAKATLESFLDGVTKGLKKRGSRVTLVGFGTFRKVYRKTRMGRNPQTGEKIKIKGRNAVTFKPGKNLI
jgi:DNA-binding protein HU-beta